jgi:hypothetical protein
VPKPVAVIFLFLLRSIDLLYLDCYQIVARRDFATAVQDQVSVNDDLLPIIVDDCLYPHLIAIVLDVGIVGRQSVSLFQLLKDYCKSAAKISLARVPDDIGAFPRKEERKGLIE